MGRIENVSIDIDRIPSGRWPLDASLIAATAFAPLARSLAAVVIERYGSVLAYPDPVTHTTRVRFEWQMDRSWRNWWRLGIILAGSPAEQPDISAYVGLGDGQPERRGEITLRGHELRVIASEFDRVLTATAARLNGPPDALRQPLFYVELPPPWSVGSDVELPAFSATVRSSAIVRPNEARVAAVGLTVRETSVTAAREIALARIAELAAVIALVCGGPVTAWTRYPRDFRHRELMRGRREAVYPARFFRLDTTDGRRDLVGALAPTATLVGLLQGSVRDVWIRMLLGYASATELVGRHPTIAAVAYLAALGAGLHDVQCGKAVCPDHGHVVQHGVRGERRLIADRLVDRGIVDSAEREALERLLRRVYADQRSAFVHDAELAHNERSDTRLLALPTDTDVVSVEWHRRDDLARIAALTRALVFAELGARSGSALVGAPVRVSVNDRTGVDGSIRVRPDRRLAIRGLGSKPMYAVAERGVAMHLGIRDVVSDGA